MTFKEFLAQRGISQRALAKKARVEHAALSRWISGKVSPRFESVKRLADALGCPLETIVELLGGSEDSATEITGFLIYCAAETMKTIRGMSVVMLGAKIPDRAKHALNTACKVLVYNIDDFVTSEYLIKRITPQKPPDVTADDAVTAANTLRYILVLSKAIDKMDESGTSICFSERDIKTAIDVLVSSVEGKQ